MYRVTLYLLCTRVTLGYHASTSTVYSSISLHVLISHHTDYSRLQVAIGNKLDTANRNAHAEENLKTRQRRCYWFIERP